MKKLTVYLALIIPLGIIAFFAIAYISAANNGNRLETSIAYAHEESRNVLGQYEPMLRDALGVTKIQTGALERVITSANESRYGGNGSGATVQWIQEQNPNLDQSNYKRIIDMVESGRADFRNAQKDKLDRIRSYKIALGAMPGSFFMRMAGYPTQEYLSKHYDKIVISGHAGDAFVTGRDDGANLNGF